MSDAPAQLRVHARTIIDAAIAAADPGAAVERALPLYPDVTGADDVHLIAIGKAAATMTLAAMRHLRARSIDVVVPHGADIADVEGSDGVRIIQAAHPLPDLSSLAAGNAIDELISSFEPGETVLFLISGGASSLAVLPEGRITFIEYAHCTELLMRAGADIREINTVRHHIDSLKGGGIAQRTTHARVLGLVLSDVVGDELDVIASGPLTTPSDTAGDAIRVLRSRGVWEQCAPSIRETLSEATRAALHGDTAHVRMHVIAGNRTAVDGAAAAAARLGYHVETLDRPLAGEAREAGTALAHAALQHVGQRPLCMVAGGETTVTVRGNGTGGRSQELALAAALALDGADGIVIAACGTDGIDGPTDAAGAICDADTIAAIGADAARRALADNDSHAALDAAGALIRTGPSGTNVADIAVVLRA